MCVNVRNYANVTLDMRLWGYKTFFSYRNTIQMAFCISIEWQCKDGLLLTLSIEMLGYLEDGFTSSFLVAILIVKRGNRMQCRVDERRAVPWVPKIFSSPAGWCRPWADYKALPQPETAHEKSLAPKVVVPIEQRQIVDLHCEFPEWKPLPHPSYPQSTITIFLPSALLWYQQHDFLENSSARIYQPKASFSLASLSNTFFRQNST